MASARPARLRPTESDEQGTDSDSPKDERSLPADDPTAFVLPASELLTVIGQDGCFKRVAPAFLPAFGYVETELLDRPFLSFIHPADTAATGVALDKLKQAQPTLGHETAFAVRMRRTDGWPGRRYPRPRGCCSPSLAMSPNEAGRTRSVRGPSRASKQTRWHRKSSFSQQCATTCSSRSRSSWRKCSSFSVSSPAVRL
jgi:PAS domain-containing protein